MTEQSGTWQQSGKANGLLFFLSFFLFSNCVAAVEN